MRLSGKEFASLVSEALQDLPAALAERLGDISIEVEPWPDAETCQSLGLEDPSELMGLYQGTPLTERSVEDSGMLPDRIVLYQGSIEAAAGSRAEVVEEIRTTVLHEVGHHFGLEEEDLDELGYE